MADNDNKDNKKESPFLTTGEQVRNFIGIAFVVSILIHLLATPLFPNLVQHHEDDQVEKMAVVKKPTIVHTPPPTPPPTPQPQKQQPQKQQQHSQPQLKVQPPKSTNSGSGAPSESKYVPPASGNENGAPSGGGTGPPGPPATAKPSCPDPSREATASNIVQPEYPDSARDLGLGTVTVLVEVTIGPTGALEEAKISQSSGNMAIDQSALRAARQSTYTPQLADCAPTTGSYIFHAEFSPDN